MSDRHLRQPWHDGLSGGHIYPRPSDRHPVFMFGIFCPPNGRMGEVRASRASIRRGATIDRSATATRPIDQGGTATMAATEGSAFMFGVHPE